MKKLFVLVLVLTGAIHSVSAQRQIEEEEPQKTGFDKSKLFFGGNLGASFGDYTLANISPQVGYRFNDLFRRRGGSKLYLFCR